MVEINFREATVQCTSLWKAVISMLVILANVVLYFLSPAAYGRTTLDNSHRQINVGKWLEFRGCLVLTTGLLITAD